jgi:hypothetical protein
MLITNDGTIIRTSVSSINVYSRTAAGVIIMRLDEGCIINNIARLDKEEEIEKESAEVEREMENAVISEQTPVIDDADDETPETEAEDEVEEETAEESEGDEE